MFQNVYPVSSRVRGHAVIINFRKHRKGSEVDEEMLKRVFRQLGFTITVKEDVGGRVVSIATGKLQSLLNYIGGASY